MPSRGDESHASFDAQVLPHMDDLYRTAVYLRRSPTDAEDLLQETLLRAFRAWDRFVPVSDCRAWLFTILYNAHRNRLRGARRAPTAVDIDEADDGPLAAELSQGTASDPAEIVARDGFDDEIDAALATLPEDFLNPLILVDLQDFTYEEAAAVLSCPVGTIRSRLFRARKLLHRQLFEYGASRGLVRVK